MAHIRESRPDSGLGLPGRVLATFQGVASLLGSLPRTMNRFNIFRKSNPQQIRQLVVQISNSKQEVDDFEGELTF